MSEKPKTFPPELRRALKALANENRERIFLLLTAEGSSYTELLNQLRMRKGSLTHHLRTLVAAGLVRNFGRNTLQGPYDSFYSTTGFGESLVGGILFGIEPPTPQFEGTWFSPTTPLRFWTIETSVEKDIFRRFGEDLVTTYGTIWGSTELHLGALSGGATPAISASGSVAPMISHPSLTRR